LDTQVNLLDRFKTEVYESDEPPNYAPCNEKVVRERPLIELHMTHLDPPNLECGGSRCVSEEVLQQERCYRYCLQIQNYAVAVKAAREGLFGHDWIKLPEVESQPRFCVALVRAVQVVVT